MKGRRKDVLIFNRNKCCDIKNGLLESWKSDKQRLRSVESLFVKERRK